MKNNCNLRNKVLLLLLLAVAGIAKAQTHEFAPVGAEWYYERFYREDGFYLTGITYDRFRSLRTVEINGWECKEIELFQNLDCHGEVNPYTEIRYISQEGDRVYEVENGQRFLLYDFGKEVGEWWYAPKYDDTITVINVNYITLDDGTVRKQLETQLSNLDWYIYNIIEGVGMDYTLFPYYYVDGALCVQGPLRCYSENGVPLIEWGERDCDYEILVVDERERASVASMNTLVEDMLHIDFAETASLPKQIRITNVSAITIYAQETMGNSLDINFTDKPAGVYLVQIVMDSKVFNDKIVKR
jgi:hypothetical protein